MVSRCKVWTLSPLLIVTAALLYEHVSNLSRMVVNSLEILLERSRFEIVALRDNRLLRHEDEGLAGGGCGVVGCAAAVAVVGSGAAVEGVSVGAAEELVVACVSEEGVA